LVVLQHRRSTAERESTTVTGDAVLFRVRPEARSYGRDPCYLTRTCFFTGST
jgi:hypothetical protein